MIKKDRKTGKIICVSRTPRNSSYQHLNREQRRSLVCGVGYRRLRVKISELRKQIIAVVKLDTIPFRKCPAFPKITGKYLTGYMGELQQFARSL